MIELTAIEPVAGIRLSTIKAGVRYPDRKDLVLFEIADDAKVSAVFTKNHFCAAPVIVCREHLKKTTPKYLIINTGNANAGTGDDGIAHTLEVCEALAQKTGADINQILPFSTGVTAEKLPVSRITASIGSLVDGLVENAWQDAAEGIMTTDTVPKAKSLKFKINNDDVTISGITKGSGMIRPDMATMLSFIATDARIEQMVLDKMLQTAVNKSFNRITVDGDTSTNDSCVLIATGKAANLDTTRAQNILLEKLAELMVGLAKNMVRDAEGATKFITVKVTGGANSSECLTVAYTIAHSPLVKTAFFASDPNWGRIMVALGNSQIDNLDIKQVNAWLGEVLILENGQMAKTYSEAKGAEIMQQDEIIVRIDLGRGEFKESVWTSDLSHEYVAINADYRT